MKTLKIYLVFVISIFSVAGCSCSYARRIANNVDKDTINIMPFPAKENDTYLLKNDLDLKGKAYLMPKGVTIKLQNCVIQNGILIGQNTKIEGNMPFLDKVTIKGSWNVPEISTKMFKDLNYDNSLRDVMALCNPEVNNKVVIESGVYYVSVEKNEGVGIRVSDNTNLTLNGTIIMKPNQYSNYDVLFINGKNITLSGNGVICGDKEYHLGQSGEWGMGIEIGQAKNVTIDGINVKDCWGDCIYIGDKSKNILIRNCNLTNGRRQGVSITSADRVRISNCVISNVAGTDPQFAIDVEPNKGQTVANISIKNVKSINCVGGFLVTGIAPNSKIRNISFSECEVKGATVKYPVVLMNAETISVNNSIVDSNSEFSMLIQNINSFKAQDNVFRAKGKNHLNRINSKKLEINNNEYIIKK